MSYRKEYVADGGCPEQSARIKIISMHLDGFENAPTYTQTIKCNDCPNFFKCVFEHEPCVVYKCVKRKYNWLPIRNDGNEMRLNVPSRFSDAVMAVVKYGIGIAQKTR